jgi:hypothetical protein
MELNLITVAEHTRVVHDLQKQIDEIKTSIAPLIRENQDSEEIFTWKQAIVYVRLSPHGLSEARRQGRIKGVKINGKEFGYKKEELDKYLKRYNKQ